MLSHVVVFLFLSLALPLQTAGSTPLQRAQSLLKEGKEAEALPLLLEAHRSQPLNGSLCQQIALVYTGLQQFGQAAEFYRKALAVSPRMIAARKNLGVVLWFSGQKDEAQRVLMQVQQELPNDPVPHFYLGMIEHEHHQFKAAGDHFSKAGDLAFGNPEAFTVVLETGLAAHDESLVQQLLDSAQKSDSFGPELWFQAGSLFGRFGFYDKAIHAFQRIRGRYGDPGSLLRNLGLAQLQAKRYPEAQQSFEELTLSHPASAEGYLFLAETFAATEQLQKAYDAYAKAIEVEPRFEEAYTALADFAVSHHNSSFALKVLGQGLQQLPGSSRLLLQQGVVQALDDKMPQAEESFRQATLAGPKEVLPILALGLTQLQTSQLDAAVKSFERASAIAADDYRAFYFRALTLARQGGQDQSAERRAIVAALQQALKLNSRHADSHVLLGQTYLSGNMTDQAISELEQALSLESNNTTALYQLGLAYRKKGEVQKAQKIMSQFEDLKSKQRKDEDLARKELVQILKVVRER